MTEKRWTTAAIAVMLLLCAAAVDAGLVSRTKDATKALFGPSTASECWVVFPPTQTAAGDLEVVCMALRGSDPRQPAVIVRFQETDGAVVGRKIRTGTLLTLKRGQVELGGLLPIYVVQPKKAGGWKAKWVKYASDTMGQWGYLVAGRILAGDSDELDRFFGTRLGLAAQLEHDVARVGRAVFPEGLPQDSARPVCSGACGDALEICSSEALAAKRDETAAENRAELTRESLQKVHGDLSACEVSLGRTGRLFDQIRGTTAAGHHPAVRDLGLRGRALVDDYRRESGVLVITSSGTAVIGEDIDDWGSGR